MSRAKDIAEGIVELVVCFGIGAVIITLLVTFSTFANNGRHVFIGASPKGVVTFDTATGETAVRHPIFSDQTTTTLPAE